MTVPPQIITAFDNLVTIVTVLAAAMLAFLISMAGFHYMTSGGSPQKMQQSKDYGQAALVGFAVVVLARVIASWINTVVPH